MRYIHRPWDVDFPGGTRIISTFLLLPVRINDETRWLEKATREQRLIRGIRWGSTVWMDEKWVDG